MIVSASVQLFLIDKTILMICALGKFYHKRPNRLKMNLHLEDAFQSIPISDQVAEHISNFLNSDNMTSIMNLYILDKQFIHDNGSIIRITKQSFDEQITELLSAYLFQLSDDIYINNGDLSTIISNVTLLIESQIIVKMKPNNASLENDTAEIRLHIEKISKYILKGATQQTNYGLLEQKYIKLLKDNYKTTSVYGLDILDMEKFYIFPRLSYYDREKKLLSGWESLFENGNIITIIGGPGYGKTTFLKNIILNFHKLTCLNSKKSVPVYCDLKNYSTWAYNNPKYSITDFLLDSLLNSQKGVQNIDSNFIEYLLNNGKGLFLFDAVDEVKKEVRDELYLNLVSFFKNQNPLNQVIFTTRVNISNSDIDSIFSICSLNSTEAKSYLQKLKMNNIINYSNSDITKFIAKVNPLINSSFVTSFLMLTMLHSIFKTEQEIPETKSKLYGKCVEQVVRKRERNKNKADYDFEKFNYILDQDHTFQLLAKLGMPLNKNVHEDVILKLLSEEYSVFFDSQASAYNSSKVFLEFCDNRTDLYVVGTIQDTFKFYHRSFFDYYVVKYIISMTNDPFKQINLLATFPSDSEVFELFPQLLKEYNYNQYINFFHIIMKNYDFSYQVEEAISQIYVNIQEINLVTTYLDLIINNSDYSKQSFRVAESIYRIIKKYPLELSNYTSKIIEDNSFDITLGFIHNMFLFTYLSRANINHPIEFHDSLGNNFFWYGIPNDMYWELPDKNLLWFEFRIRYMKEMPELAVEEYHAVFDYLYSDLLISGLPTKSTFLSYFRKKCNTVTYKKLISNFKYIRKNI